MVAAGLGRGGRAGEKAVGLPVGRSVCLSAGRSVGRGEAPQAPKDDNAAARRGCCLIAAAAAEVTQPRRFRARLPRPAPSSHIHEGAWSLPATPRPPPLGRTIPSLGAGGSGQRGAGEGGQ